jgi:hypothetical protein
VPARSLKAVVLLVAVALVPAASAQAAITVSNTGDSGPGSLRQAILDAPPGETINVPAGTYTLTSKQLTVEKSLTISGHAASDTIISGGGAFRVIGVGGAGNSVTISGVTIRDGHDNQPGGIAAGAGIGNDEANLTLRNVVVTNNHADASNPAGPGGIAEGGGVASAGGSLTIEGSAITNNSATAAGGAEKNGPGGIAEGGGLASFGGASLTIRDTNISGNVADVRGGGAKGPGGIVEGGGAFLEIEPTTAVAISNDTVSANVADASAGAEGPGGIVEAGGLFLDLSQGQVTASNLTIAGNSAHAPGGSAGGIVEGGGLLVETGKGATLTLISATIAGNSADAAGGIVEGGNIEPDPGTKIANSIVSGGSGGSTGDCAEKLESLGFNLESADQCGFTAGGDQVNKDPLLGPLQNNGGPAPTMVPAANSPAVDQGAPFGLTTDERGVVRPIDFPTIPNSAAAGANGSDVGAAELQPSNAFTVGKLKKNKKKGIATLTVDLPQPSLGTLTLHGKGLKTQTVAIAGQAELKLKVQGTKKVKKALRKHGKRKVTIEVTYAPTGNSPATQALKAKLVLKHKKHKKHGKKRH